VLAFAWIGAGLDEVIEKHLILYRECVAAKGVDNCTIDIDAMSLVSPQLLLGFAALAVISLVPVALRHFKARKTT
jgi:hypothetical protein